MKRPVPGQDYDGQFPITHSVEILPRFASILFRLGPQYIYIFDTSISNNNTDLAA